MVEEYHDDYLHVVIDCKTRNKDFDVAIEKTISGYVYLVVHAAKIGKLGELIDMVQVMIQDFGVKRNDK